MDAMIFVLDNVAWKYPKLGTHDDFEGGLFAPPTVVVSYAWWIAKCNHQRSALPPCVVMETAADLV